jgi:hypothetical protein
MDLDVNGHITENPSADDIARAIDVKPYPEDWYINLDPGDDSFIEATPMPDGGFTLKAAVDKRRFTAAAPVDAARLKTILIKYLNRDAGWRAECPWKDDRAKSAAKPARDTSEPPPLALAIIVGTIVVVGVIFFLSEGRNSWFRSLIPDAYSDYFYIGLIALPMVVLVLVMVATKLIQARRAADWPQTTGKILKAGMVAKHHKFSGEATTVTNVPVVEYEFTANGSSWRGSRISIGEDTGGANSEATLKRYAAGTSVTVFYDPKDPSNCVLEREIPKGFGKGCGIIIAVVAAFVVGTWYLTTNASRLLAAYLPNAQAPAAVFATCFGLAVLLFFFASRKASKRAMTWPSVPGKIVSSGVEAIAKRQDGRTTTSYTPAVEFDYQVHGIDYHSRQINLGIALGGSQAAAEKVAARYPEGSTVDVHYDPTNPSNAALENPTGYSWLLLAIALFCFGVAIYASGVFK